MRLISRLYLILLCLLLWTASAQAETVDRIVAVVNGDIILYSELQDFVRVNLAARPEMKTDDPAKKVELEREALRQLIRNKLAEVEVKRLKISVTPQDVDQTIDNIKKEGHLTDAQFLQTVQQQGKTLDQFKEVIKKEMERGRLLDRVLKSKTVITDDQVNAYLNKKPVKGKSEGPLRHRLALIYLPFGSDSGKSAEDAEKQAQDLLSRINAGKSFAELAKQYSKGPSAGEGGDIGFVAAGELAPFIDSAIQGLKKNEVSGLVKGPGGYYLIKILDVEKDSEKSEDSVVREKVRRELFQSELNRKFDEWVRDLESKAFIKITL